ncbi:uncharacterized protein TNCV_3114191 [Trichonephila clavipes]|nr:uncharacterized protein TNCV_3114191 [Trichonephila clavipes]
MESEPKVALAAQSYPHAHACPNHVDIHLGTYNPTRVVLVLTTPDIVWVKGMSVVTPLRAGEKVPSKRSGVKFVVLKKRGYDGKHDNNSQSENKTEDKNNDSKKCKLSDDKESANNKDTPTQSNILHSHSSPSILGMASPQVQNADHAASPVTSPIFWSSDLPPGHVPQPPPRRKYSMKGKENRGAKYEESIRQMYGEKESTSKAFKFSLAPVLNVETNTTEVSNYEVHLLNYCSKCHELVTEVPRIRVLGPLKIRRVEGTDAQICQGSLSSRWHGVEVWTGKCQLRCRPRHLKMFQIAKSAANSPCVVL